MTDPSDPISNAIQTAVLKQRIEAMETKLTDVSQAVQDIKEMIAEIKGGYKVTSTIVMVVGTIIGFFASAIAKGIFK